MKTALFLLLALSATLGAADTPPAAKPKPVKIERDLQYVPGGDPAQSLDLYLPDPVGDKPLPVVVWIHGGGWNGGSKAGGYCHYVLQQGYAMVSMEYRFSKVAVFPAQIQDCQAGIRWLRANSKKYHLDPDHIGVIGASAGGHLVSLLGTAGGSKAFPPVGGNLEQSDRVQAVVDLFGPTDFTTVAEQAAKDRGNDGYNLGNGGENSPYTALIGEQRLGDEPEKEAAASPVHFVSENSAPCLIAHGTVDRSVPYAQAVQFFDALKEAGVEVYLQTFPNVGHGGAVFDANPLLERQISAFFDRHLRRKDVKLEPLFNSFRSSPGKPK